MRKQNTTMLQRPIPSTGEILPVIGLGTWKGFDVDAQGPKRQDLLEVLGHMTEKRATFIDSSPMYGLSEYVVGELTQALDPEKYFYATKVWIEGEKAGIRQMEASMERMKRRIMDLMQVHNLVDCKTQLKTLRRWKEEGKVRYIGVTHYQAQAHAALEDIISKEKIDFVQFNYSILDRHAEKSLLGTARHHGVAVIINEPLAKGSLFRKMQGKALPEWAGEYGISTWTAFFLKYILAHPAVNCVIPGTANPEHMLEILEAGEGIMPDEEGRKRMLKAMDLIQA